MDTVSGVNMRIRLIDLEENNAFYNMALDEALLNLSDGPVFRLYSWNPAAVTIGYNQTIKNIDLEYCKRKNIDVVRRITGGKALMHDKELTYSFIISKDKMPKSVIESYKIISRPILCALNYLGIKAEFKDTGVLRYKTPLCLNNISWYEITVEGKKVAAAAQKRLGDKLLQHGSILLDIDHEKQCRVFHQCNEELIRKSKKRIASIREYNENININKLKKELIACFDSGLFESDLTKQEKDMANKLVYEKYSASEWNSKI